MASEKNKPVEEVPPEDVEDEEYGARRLLVGHTAVTQADKRFATVWCFMALQGGERRERRGYDVRCIRQALPISER